MNTIVVHSHSWQQNILTANLYLVWRSGRIFIFNQPHDLKMYVLLINILSYRRYMYRSQFPIVPVRRLLSRNRPLFVKKTGAETYLCRRLLLRFPFSYIMSGLYSYIPALRTAKPHGRIQHFMRHLYDGLHCFLGTGSIVTCSGALSQHSDVVVTLKPAIHYSLDN